MVKCGPAGMRAHHFMVRIRDKVRVSVELVLGLVMVLGLAHFTFCHTSSPQKHPCRPTFYL